MIIPPSADQAPASSSTHTTYRIKRGTKLADIPSYHESIPPLSSLNGPFQLSEYLTLKIKHDPHDVKALVEVPKNEETVGGKAPEKNVWIYEHLRRLPIDLTPLLTSLITVCSKKTCPEMKADQWMYFCSAHQRTAEDCCAIDYILHTIDTTTALLNSSQQFPSRLSIPPASLSHFPSLFRRISRIFSHAYYHHRETFQLSESETSLYARFLALCEKYELVGSSILVIPREAIGSFSPTSHSEDDEEEESEDSDEEEEEDEVPERPSNGRGRGEKGDDATSDKRTRSLDRHPPPISSPVDLKKPPTTHLDKSPVRPNFDRDQTISSGNNDDPFRASPRGGTISRGTLGRGKQSRGTMLWTSDDPVPSSTENQSILGAELTRTESNQTAVLLEEDEKDEGNAKDEGEEERSVPKDEIELLEEEGAIPPQPSVSPLPPLAAGDPDKKGEKEDDMEDVELEDGKDPKGQDGITSHPPAKSSREGDDKEKNGLTDVKEGDEKESSIRCAVRIRVMP